MRAALMGTHIVVGVSSTLLTLMAVFSGPLALVWKPDDAGGSSDVAKWALANAASVAAGLLTVTVVLTLWEASHAQLAALKAK